MVPRIAKGGASFKGATLYYLHDKKAKTSERVAFTETLNLPTNDPKRATAHMIDTADNADALKRESGIKGGRKLEKPVYCYSLSWHPTEAPTKAEQIEAGKETLALLGLDQNQALIVAHTDTDHPHIHVIVNRVNPDTGRAVTVSNDRLKLSQWAQEYEQARGQVFCEKRVQHNEERKERFVKDQSETYAWRKAESDKVWQQYRDQKAERQRFAKARYKAMYDRRKRAEESQSQSIRQRYKPKWRSLFKRQKQALNRYDNSFAKRIKEAFTNRKAGRALTFARAIANDSILRADFIKTQEAERQALGREQRQERQQEHAEIREQWQSEKDAFNVDHRAQSAKALAISREESAKVWKKASAPEREKSERPQQAGENLTAQQQEQIEQVKAKLRSDRNKARGRTRKPRR